MAGQTFLDYDKENDLLFLYKKQPSKGSIDMGNLVVDISHDGKVVGLEIFDASRVLSDVTGMKITQSMLGQLKKASLKIIYRPDGILIAILLSISHEETISARIYPIPPIENSPLAMSA